jgi:SNF2 family DNA or RNA helicase
MNIKELTREQCLELLPWNYEFYREPFLHQMQTVIWASSQEESNFGLFFEMGTGKSQTVIDYLRLCKVQDKILVVTVNFPLAHNWVEEFRMNAPYMKGLVLEGSREQRLELLNISTNFYVINYEGIKTIFNELKKIQWNAIIIDESRKIMNPTAQRSQLCIALGENVPHKILLSGTPTVHPTDIFTQYLFLDGGKTYGNNYFAFRNRYFKDEAKEELIKQLLTCYEDKTIAALLRVSMDYVGRWREESGIQINPNKKRIFIPKYRLRMQKWVFKDDEKEKEFLELMNSKSIRFIKKDTLDLPDKIYQKLYVELPKQQASDYLKLLHKDKKLSVITLTSKQLEMCFTKYSQITGGFFKVGENDYRFYPENPKLDLLSDLIYDAIDNTKVVVFHRFIAEGRLIERRLKKEGIPFASMRSEIKDTTAEYKRFLTDEKTRVMVAHPLSGGIGLNFTNSSICVYFSLDYSVEGYLQSQDRSHRIGQKENVTYYHLTMKDTIDEEVWKSHQEGISLMRRVNDYQLTMEQVARGQGERWKESF